MEQEGHRGIIPTAEVSILIQTADKNDFLDIRSKLTNYYYKEEEVELDKQDKKLEGLVGEFINISEQYNKKYLESKSEN
jgi:hypothetical protein